ncbi:MAG: GAF and ANTAR domain-containing protein [Nitriliruptoraceae bacterium]
MNHGNFDRVLGAIASQPPGLITDRFCAAAASGLSTPGVSVALAGTSASLETIFATPEASNGDTLQADLGEGPSFDAHRLGWPIIVENLSRDSTWPAFSRAATDHGLRAMFAFPLRSGAMKLGALTLSRPVAGGLDPQLYTDALIYARLGLDLLLTNTATDAPDVALEQIFTVGADSALIHQATGMVSVQLGAGLTEALALLRAHAYASNQSLSSLAQDVVARRTRLD